LNPLQLAKDAYMSSTSFIDNNYRKKWEDNLRLFQNRHPQGSKYNSDFYKHRSKLFRPKTRAVVRKNEAAAAIAFFANPDVVTCEPENKSDPMQLAGAGTMQELLNYRLQKSIPWYQILIGGVQDAQVYGVVCSYQYWKYEPGKHDKPCVELLPIENIRFDPNADWSDVIGTTPILQRVVPMYVADVRRMMISPNPKTGAPGWNPLDDGQIRQSQVEFDTTRQAREDQRQDPKTEHGSPIKDFEVVWAMENFLRWDGEELVYWTLGMSHMLTEPAPLKDVYFHGERPLAMGVGMIETHRVMPDSLVNVGSHLQQEANELVNQRLDNVKLVLNKRWLVKSGRNIDVDSLNRNVPGGVTLGDDVSDDSLREVNWPDVTASAYMEQDRINADMDDLVGNFAGSSVMTNRKLNETVGGMAMMSQASSQLTEYLLRTITETWVEKVLRQLVKLEQYYETDMTVLAIAGQRANLQRYGISEVSDQLLNQELTIRVNVGMNATDPMLKMQKFLAGTNAYAQVAANAPPNMNVQEVGKEIFGMIGYKDGSRFLEDVDPRLMQAQEAIKKLQMLIEELQAQLEDKAEDKQLEAAKLQIDAQKAQAEVQLKQAQAMQIAAEGQGDGGMEMQKKWAEVELKAQQQLAMIEMKRQELAAKQELEQQKAIADIALKAQELDAKIALQAQEIDAKVELEHRKMRADLEIDAETATAKMDVIKRQSEAKIATQKKEAEAKRVEQEAKDKEQKAKDDEKKKEAAEKEAEKKTAKATTDALVTAIKALTEQVKAMKEEIGKPRPVEFKRTGGVVNKVLVDGQPMDVVRDDKGSVKGLR
jgi:hypothetical protein